MEGKLVIKEEIEVTDIATAKRILETINDFSSVLSDEFLNGFTKENEKKEAEEIIEQLRSGELLRGVNTLVQEERKERLELTEKGKNWLRKKRTELK